MVQAAVHKKIVRKSTKHINRFHSDRLLRIKSSWRKPRGIDNPLRRHYRGQGAMPGVGFGSDKKTKFMDRTGFKRVLVNNLKELEALLMHNKTFAAVIAHKTGARLRKQIVERARELDIKVVNETARLKTEEQK